MSPRRQDTRCQFAISPLSSGYSSPCSFPTEWAVLPVAVENIPLSELVYFMCKVASSPSEVLRHVTKMSPSALPFVSRFLPAPNLGAFQPSWVCASLGGVPGRNVCPARIRLDNLHCVGCKATGPCPVRKVLPSSQVTQHGGVAYVPYPPTDFLSSQLLSQTPHRVYLFSCWAILIHFCCPRNLLPGVSRSLALNCRGDRQTPFPLPARQGSSCADH